MLKGLLGFGRRKVAGATVALALAVTGALGVQAQERKVTLEDMNAQIVVMARQYVDSVDLYSGYTNEEFKSPSEALEYVLANKQKMINDGFLTQDQINAVEVYLELLKRLNSKNLKGLNEIQNLIQGNSGFRKNFEKSCKIELHRVACVEMGFFLIEVLDKYKTLDPNILPVDIRNKFNQYEKDLENMFNIKRSDYRLKILEENFLLILIIFVLGIIGIVALFQIIDRFKEKKK